MKEEKSQTEGDKIVAFSESLNTLYSVRHGQKTKKTVKRESVTPNRNSDLIEKTEMRILTYF